MDSELESEGEGEGDINYDVAECLIQRFWVDVTTKPQK